MKKWFSFLGLVLFLSMGFFADAMAQSRKNRVDFDNMRIKGQTKQSDTAYFMERRNLGKENLAQERKTYRDEIMRTKFKVKK